MRSGKALEIPIFLTLYAFLKGAKFNEYSDQAIVGTY
jgi:hypothetical protein